MNDTVLDVASRVPPVIYVREKTLLCRWDSACAGNHDNDDDSAISYDEATKGSSSDQVEDCVDCAPATTKPPRIPQRSRSPEKMIFASKVLNHRAASLSSGINVGSIRLKPVDFSQTTVKPVLGTFAMPLSNILEISASKNSSPGTPVTASLTAGGATRSRGGQDVVTAVFCIRRAGCGSCRLHGLQLTKLAKQIDVKVNLFGIIKEIGGSDKALTEFYSEYFPFPLYKDTDDSAFRFLGDRKLSVWKFLRTGPMVLYRYHKKNIRNLPVSGGDAFTQGGIMLFDKFGNLRYVYYERYGDELDMEALRWAINECKQQPTSTSTRSSPFHSSVPVEVAVSPRQPTRQLSHTELKCGASGALSINDEDECHQRSEEAPRKPCRRKSIITTITAFAA